MSGKSLGKWLGAVMVLLAAERFSTLLANPVWTFNPSGSPSNTIIQVEFQSASNQIYSVVGTASLTGFWSVVHGDVAGTGGSIILTDTNHSPAYFYRLTSLTNRSPRFFASPFSTDSGTIDLMYSDTIAGAAYDPDAGDMVSYSKLSGPAWLEVLSNGSLSGIPLPGDSGTNSFTVQAADGNGGSDQAILNIVVTQPNVAPVAQHDGVYQVSSLEALSIDPGSGVLANDTDADGDLLAAVLLDSTDHGALDFRADGSFIYTPWNGYSGSDSFTYQVSDFRGGNDTATVSINVADDGQWTLLLLDDFNDGTFGNYMPASDPRFYSVSDFVRIRDNSTLTLSNAVDVSSYPAVRIEYDLSSLAMEAGDETFVETYNGSAWVPLATHYYGTDNQNDFWTHHTHILTSGLSSGFKLRFLANGVATDSSLIDNIAIWVQGSTVNDAPEAQDDYYTMLQDSVMTINAAGGVLANDLDLDGDTLTVSVDTDVVHGTLSLASDGSFTYTPNAGYTGRDDFIYTVSDGTASAIGQVELGVFSTSDNILLSGALREVFDGAGNKVNKLLNNPNYPDNPDWSDIVYDLDIPDAGYNRYGQRIRGYLNVPSDGYYYFLADVADPDNNQAYIYISPDANPENVRRMVVSSSSTIHLTAGVRHYFEIRAQGAVGDNSFRILWRQAGTGDDFEDLTVIGNEYLSGTYFDGSPVVKDIHEYATFRDTTLSEAAPGLLNHVTDGTGSMLSVSLAGPAANGTAVIHADGSFTYTPASGFSGIDSFGYQVTDDFGRTSSTGTVTVLVADNAVMPADYQLTNWSYGGGNASLVASAELTGRYAVADREQDYIEIRDIRQALRHTITSAQILAVMPGADLSGSYGPCSLGFSRSGRFLFIGICSAAGGAEKDAVLQYNCNTKELTVFDRLTIASTMAAPVNYGLLHAIGNLYVGTDNGLYTYDAQRNVRSGNPEFHYLPNDRIKALAVDLYDEQLYAATDDSIYRLDIKDEMAMVNNAGTVYNTLPLQYADRVPDLVARVSNIISISMAREFGNGDRDGLYIQERVHAGLSRIWRISNANLRRHQPVPVTGLAAITGDLKGICVTPCGRMMLAMDTPQLLTDTSDTRDGFETWLRAYAESAADVMLSDIHPLAPGLTKKNALWCVSELGFSDETAPSDVGDSYSAMMYGNTALMADRILGRNDARSIFRDALLTELGPGSAALPRPERNVDGYSGVSGHPSNASIGKFRTLNYKNALANAASAADHFADDPEMKDLFERYFEQNLRLGDYSFGEGRNHKPVERLGPPIGKDAHGLNGESGAQHWNAQAQDPDYTQWFTEYFGDPSRSVNPQSSSHYLDGESNAGNAVDVTFYQFYELYAWHGDFHSNAAWKQDFQNGIHGYCGWTDDNRNPYLTVHQYGEQAQLFGIPTTFAAGADIGTDDERHPWDTVDFNAAFALCIQGDTWPSVANYLAYREGRSVRMQKMYGHDNKLYAPGPMLTRWTRFEPTWRARSAKFYSIGIWGALDKDIATAVMTTMVRPGVEETVTTNGNVRLHYRQLTPRRVLASDDGINWTSYGFQYTPFTFDAGVSYANYKVEDPEGIPMMSLIENEDFDMGDLSGWTQDGTYTFGITSNTSEHVTGASATIETTSADSDASSRLINTLDCTPDYEGSRYIVRGDGLMATPSATGQGRMLAQWDNDSDPLNGTLSETASAVVLNAANPRVEFRVDMVKPSGATHLHLVFEAQRGVQEDARYVFDNASVVRQGPETLTNGGFESGDLSNWSLTEGRTGMMSVTGNLSEVLDGNHALKIATLSSDTEATLTYDLDVSSDLSNSRYVVKMRIDAVNQSATDVLINIIQSKPDGSDHNSRLQYKVLPHFVDDTYAGGAHEHVFGVRTLDGSSGDNIRLEIKVVRNGGSENDEIILDDIRIEKEAIYPACPSVRGFDPTL